MSEDFDFIKAFADFDLLAAEAVGMLVGRAIGATFNGMIAAGLSEEQALHAMRVTLAELFRSVRP